LPPPGAFTLSHDGFRAGLTAVAIGRFASGGAGERDS